MPGANILQLTQDLRVTAGPQRKEVTGAPNNCFLLNICSEKQKLHRIFYSLRKTKNLFDDRSMHVQFSKLIQ